MTHSSLRLNGYGNEGANRAIPNLESRRETMSEEKKVTEEKTTTQEKTTQETRPTEEKKETTTTVTVSDNAGNK